MKYLPKIQSPKDIKDLSSDELVELASEIRHDIIAAVSQTGGHLASNLGAVELTLALHYVLDLPTDRVVWDVSNQTYTHKIITGRRDRIHTLRQHGGLSGFAKRSESEYDHFGAGHASTSISAALGMAAARDNAGKSNRVVAVIGDGALSGGLAYEGLNNAGSSKKDLLVILNDNTWAISRNVGGMSHYLTTIMSDEKLNRLRDEIWDLTGRFKRRDKIRNTISRIEDSVKALLAPGMLFEKLGFRYFGPIEGHNTELLIKTLERVTKLRGPILLHVATVKGKGYGPAESNPSKFHGVGKFDKATGETTSKKGSLPAYTKVFGDTMVELGAKDDSVVAITAAMTAGTGLVDFAEKYPGRFFDVGIAEGHAGTFAAGMAVDGIKPYLTIYSSFLQRAYDHIIHDIALQKLPVVMCLDRAGLVGDDGPTHHGTFDLSFLSSIPHITIAVPKDGNELRSMLHYTVDGELDGPVAIRYPRLAIPSEMRREIDTIEWGKWERLTPRSEIVVLAVGTMVTQMQKVAEVLAGKGHTMTVVNARFVKPLDEEMLGKIAGWARVILTAEENQLSGGFGDIVASYLMSHGYAGRFKAFGIPDRFIQHGTRELLLKETGLDVDSMAAAIMELSGQKESGRFLRKLRFRKSNNDRKPRNEVKDAVSKE
ncbi:MAG: 1-deoxy-D-xylulose-5-phosphate synthase [candidate division Zixibacteria bacterium]|nr:1-deoxy-D-xylulose-5-phosphate synthase [candidate division Zixibacteria bacterium]